MCYVLWFRRHYKWDRAREGEREEQRPLACNIKRREEIKSRTSGCGSFVVPYRLPTCNFYHRPFTCRRTSRRNFVNVWCLSLKCPVLSRTMITWFPVESWQSVPVLLLGSGCCCNDIVCCSLTIALLRHSWLGGGGGGGVCVCVGGGGVEAANLKHSLGNSADSGDRWSVAFKPF